MIGPLHRRLLTVDGRLENRIRLTEQPLPPLGAPCELGDVRGQFLDLARRKIHLHLAANEVEPNLLHLLRHLAVMHFFGQRFRDPVRRRLGRRFHKTLEFVRSPPRQRENSDQSAGHNSDHHNDLSHDSAPVLGVLTAARLSCFPSSTNAGRASSAEFWKVSERLWGGNSVDHFTLNAPLTGSVSGLSQIVGDTLDGTMIGDAVLVGSNSEGFSGTQSNIAGGFSGIDLLFSNGGVLFGQDVTSTWTLNGSASTYSNGSQSLRLNGFTTLRGGAAADSFQVIGDSAFVLLGGDGNDSFNIASNLNGSANGQNGNDTLDGSGSTRAVTLLGSAGADNLIGGMFDDSLDSPSAGLRNKECARANAVPKVRPMLQLLST